MPQVTDLTDTTISLAWLRPDFDGTAGPLIGYRVEFRRSALDDDWDPAHDDLLGETECKSELAIGKTLVLWQIWEANCAKRWEDIKMGCW